MKLIKKILRLLPLIYLLIVMLFPIFTKLNFDLSDYTFLEICNIFSGFYDIVLDEFVYMRGLLGFEDLYAWFENNVVSGGLFTISFGILCYELYLSLLFLFFDFINMIFSWANKLINKGGSLDD